jgi:hypothetical protein
MNKKKRAKLKAKERERNAAKLKAGEVLLTPKGEEWRVLTVLTDGGVVRRLFATRTEAIEWCRSRNLRIRVPLDKRRTMLGLANYYTTAGVRQVVSGGLPSLGRGGDLPR